MTTTSLDAEQIAYLPNGELNAPYLLANAKVLLQEGETQLAASLFRLVLNHRKLSHCGYFGLGCCRLREGKYQSGIRLLEKAFLISNQKYIALEILQAIGVKGDLRLLEEKTLSFVKIFAQDKEFILKVSQFYKELLNTRRSQQSAGVEKC